MEGNTGFKNVMDKLLTAYFGVSDNVIVKTKSQVSVIPEQKEISKSFVCSDSGPVEKINSCNETAHEGTRESTAVLHEREPGEDDDKVFGEGDLLDIPDEEQPF